MNILVTGATGFIGSHLVDKLLTKGHTVYCTKRKSSKTQWLSNKNIEWIDFDLFSPHETLIPSDIDIIYHSAGLVAARNEQEYININAFSSVELANQALTQTKDLKKFVYISSQAAMGPSKSLKKPVTEADQMNPITAYGRSKMIAENKLSEIKDLPYSIASPSAVYGERDKAVLTIFQTTKYGIEAHIGRNDKYVSLVNVHDLVNGIILVGEKGKNSEKYFISSDEFYNWSYLLEEISKSLNKTNTIRINLPHSIVFKLATLSEFLGKLSGSVPVFNKDKGIDITREFWTCSIQKAINDLNYKQQISIPDGFSQTVDWYKQHKWL